MMPQIETDRLRVSAEELTKGDIIIHLGEQLEVYTEPEYRDWGMVFIVMPLAREGKTYKICFDPRWNLEVAGFVMLAS